MVSEAGRCLFFQHSDGAGLRNKGACQVNGLWAGLQNGVVNAQQRLKCWNE
ncbi:hypothetical protein F385_2445 [Pantoea agglomerans 299R]|jgi:hypothetical protein|nr:hypothetical protein F385_2445 [Pantoea agglomerans 299R]